MKKITAYVLLLLAIGAGTVACTQKTEYSYTTVPGDPMNTRIYTLKNGLKVYMSENHETPRIQTYIAVKVGSVTSSPMRYLPSISPLWSAWSRAEASGMYLTMTSS